MSGTDSKHGPLGYQQATFTAFDHTRGMTDGECRHAETALVNAALDALTGFDHKVEVRNEIENRPDRAFRYLVLDTFKAVGAGMAQSGQSPQAFEHAIEAYLKGDPKGIVPYVTGAHLGRYLDGASH